MTRARPHRRRRRHRSRPGRGRTGHPAPRRPAAGPTASRCWPTTWPTRPPPSRPPGRCSTTAPRATSRPASPAPSWPTRCTTWPPRSLGREDAVGRRAPIRSTAPAPFVATYRDPAFLAVAGRRRRAPPPRRRLRDGAGHLPPLRRGQDQARRRARPPHNADIPEDDHRRAGRDGRVRPVGARGVRRLRRRAASATTWAWSSPPRSCPGARSASAARSSPGPRSSPGRWSRAAPRSRSRSGCPSWPSAEVMAAVAVTEPDFGSDVGRHQGHRHADEDRRRAGSSSTA